ncbi:MAG: rhamnulokinase [Candidatus Helarchaeota archaeon]|nr:rhamnulokinase [Candidatus Helarchaeota archaeon]
MTNKKILAYDLGASSGRAILGILSKKEKKLEIEEIYRFKTGITRIFDSLFWNVLGFFNEMKKGLFETSQKHGNVDSIGIDSWGVDFVLLNSNGMVVGNPYNYRDKRTNGVLEKLTELIPKKQLFQISGLQFIQINSLVQLYSMVLSKSPLLKIARKYLMIADFFNYLFTNKTFCEYTLTSTSQIYDLETKNWSKIIIQKLGLDLDMFPEIIQPGTKIGNLLPAIANETRMGEIPIIATAAHDTAAAIAAVPAQGDDFMYLSSGTWALMGVELKDPNTSDIALKYNFTNEGGVKDTIRFLKNIIGLWLLQECKRIWEQSGKEYSYDYLTKEAEKAKSFVSFINPEDPVFLNPVNMPESIKNYCKKTNQKVPNSIGEITRCIFESLAFKYKEVYGKLKEITKKSINIFHIFGGGSKNKLLNQFAANATNLEVIAGPSESTSIGNILVQCFYSNEISTLSELRTIVRNSFDIESYSAQDVSEWEEAYKKYINVISRNFP